MRSYDFCQIGIFFVQCSSEVFIRKLGVRNDVKLFKNLYGGVEKVLTLNVGIIIYW